MIYIYVCMYTMKYYSAVKKKGNLIISNNIANNIATVLL